MGYTLKIGEAVVAHDYAAREAWMDVVERTDVLDAPANPHNSSRVNVMMPRHDTWSDRMLHLGIHDVFYGSSPAFSWLGQSGVHHDAVLRPHPGCRALTMDHLVKFRRAEHDWANNGARGAVISIEDYSQALATIRWLAWWTGWAIGNCRYPTIRSA